VRNRIEPILKIVALLCAAIFVARIGRGFLRHDPLAKVVIPELPSLKSNAPTNAPLAVTNIVVASAGTNDSRSTNLVMTKPVTNTVAVTATNTAPEKTPKPADATAMPGPPRRPPMMAGPGGPGGPPKGPPLPPLVQARVDRIVQSELLAPVIRPLPMALLGIAGKDVFLRSPSGQTGMVREGGEVGGIKLLRVATNRVLVEENGQQKELTIFSGLGSESLLPKQQNPQ
jgi:hypothetical protein